MNRRSLLRGIELAAVGSISGCLSQAKDDSNGHTLENEPEALSEEGECEYPEASLKMHEPVRETRTNSSVVNYFELHELSKTLFDFYVSRGSAVACGDAKHFRKMFRDLTDIGEYPSPNDSNSRYSTLYIRSSIGYFELDEFILYDQVLR
ncbi:hypothetical protein ACFQS4_11040 [Saliphagus sp. GCM10025317]